MSALNRAIRRLMRRKYEKENANRPIELTPIPREHWPENIVNPKRTAVWVNRDYLVQVFDEADAIIRLSINRTTILPNGHWSDQITWDELQWIKRQIGYGDSYAVEIYPRDRDIVNVSNMRHLWLLPAPLSIGWFKK